MTEKNILIKDQQGNSLYPQTQASLVIGGLSYEDLNEEIETNPTNLIEQWQSYQEQVDAVISGLRAELNAVKAVRYVIETWRDGVSWYTIYSDGWCEQGGYVNNSTAIKTIQLFKAYIDTNYSIFATSKYSTSDATLYQPHVDSLTTTSFKCASYGERGGATNSNGMPVFWETKGYII